MTCRVLINMINNGNSLKKMKKQNKMRNLSTKIEKFLSNHKKTKKYQKFHNFSLFLTHPNLKFYLFIANLQRFHRKINANCVRVSFSKDISGLEASDDAACRKKMNSFKFFVF
jgi:hypothetical protein